eukprot:gene7850-9359_t
MSGKWKSGSLVWSNVELTLNENDREGNVVQRKILSNQSGELSERQLLAIMGPSGCGKTSLLHVLSGRVAYNRNLSLTGTVQINGENVNTARHSKKIACVAQDDSLFEYLTVRETLYLAAYFAKGADTAKARLDNIVDAVMTELSLTKASETIIGSATRRGVSGGEYKRVLIGKDLMKKPRIIFLDEPTSGLDSFQAFAVMESMKTLTEHGKMVVAVIHQPRSSIFSMFDQLLLLSGGKLMYFGPAKQALSYFSSLGYECPEHFNPADFFLDLLSVNSKSPDVEIESTARIETLAQQWQHMSSKAKQTMLRGRSMSGVGSMLVPPRHQEPEAEEIKESDCAPIRAGTLACAETRAGLTAGALTGVDHRAVAIEDLDSPPPADTGAEEARHATLFASSRSDRLNADKNLWNQLRGWCCDFGMLFWRAVTENRRNYGSLIIRAGTVLFYAMILSLIYQNLDFSQQSIQDRTGLLYFMLINQSFSPLFLLLDLFPSEKIIVSREILSGAYSASAYFISRVIAELPLQILLTCVYTTIIYWAVGLQPYADNYFIFLATILLTTFTAMSIGFLVSAASPSRLVANAVGPPILIILLLFGGFYINSDSLPVGSEWVRYLSLMYWGFQALVVNEFRGESFECDSSFEASSLGCIRTGNQQIHKLSFQNAEVGMALGILLVLIFGWLTLAYVALLFNREKYLR